MADFNIRSITLRLCKVELTSRNQYSTGEYDPDIYSIIVQIGLAKPGIFGWGEWLPTSLIYEPGHIGRSPIDEWQVAQETAEALIGRDARELNRWVPAELDGKREDNAANSLLDGFDFALHDAIARALGWSVQKLLGGGYPEVPGMPLLYLGTPEAMAEKAAAFYRESGYRWFKLKPSCDLERDRETLERIRKALPEPTQFVVDPNYTMTGGEQGIVSYLNALQPLGLRICEDPIVPGLELWRSIRQQTEVKLMVDEKARGLDQVRAIGTADAAQMINIHANWAGGFRQGLHRANFAAALGIESLVGSVRYLGIGTAAYQTFSSLLPTLTPCEQINDQAYVSNTVVKTPYCVERGQIVIPDSPGLGIEIDAGKLAAATLKTVEI